MNVDLEQYLGSMGVTQENRGPLAEQLSEYMQEVVLDTVVESLTDSQRERFNEALDSTGHELEMAIEEVVQETPDLAKKIDTAIRNELAIILQSKQILDSK